MLDANAVIDDFLQSHDLDYDQKDEATYLITLPGQTKQQTHCALVIGDHSLSINAFVIRKPDQNSERVHEWLLRHNSTNYLLSYAVNELGDIYLVGRLPIELVTREEIDRIIGAIHEYCDSSFNILLELGFEDAIRREWAWRISRGESVANLEAFTHLKAH